MKVAIVTGSREWANREAIWQALDDERPDIVVHGNCEDSNGNLRGADADAEAWSRKRGVELLSSPALFAARGRKAGPIRNSFLAKLVAALIAGWPGGPHEAVTVAAPLRWSSGTPDMINKSKNWRVRTVSP